MAETPILSLVEQVRGLSSGTLGSLTGFSKYVLLDAIRVDFIAFAEGEGAGFLTWQAAWNSFWGSYRLLESVLRGQVQVLARAEGLPELTVISLLQTAAARVGDEALLDALCELKWAYVEAVLEVE